MPTIIINLINGHTDDQFDSWRTVQEHLAVKSVSPAFKPVLAKGLNQYLEVGAVYFDVPSKDVLLGYKVLLDELLGYKVLLNEQDELLQDELFDYKFLQDKFLRAELEAEPLGGQALQHKLLKTKFFEDGFLKDGFLKDGFLKDGFLKDGFLKDGFLKDGFLKDGFLKDGFRKDWFKELGNQPSDGSAKYASTTFKEYLGVIQKQFDEKIAENAFGDTIGCPEGGLKIPLAKFVGKVVERNIGQALDEYIEHIIVDGNFSKALNGIIANAIKGINEGPGKDIKQFGPDIGHAIGRGVDNGNFVQPHCIAVGA